MRETMVRSMARAQELFANLAEHEDLRLRVVRFGYDEERLQEGKGLLQAAQRWTQRYLEAHSQQLAATDAFHAAWRTAQDVYAHHLSAARRGFRQEREAQRTLELTGKRKSDFRSWSGQATTFYARLQARPDYLAQLAGHDVTAVALQRGAAQVNAAVEAKSRQYLRRSEARTVAQRRQAAQRKLHLWLHEFTRLARISLKTSPQDLIGLGLRD